MEATKQIVYLESMISSIVSSSPYSPLLRELRAFASCLRRRRCLVISILLLVSSTYSKNIADRYCYTAARKTKFKRKRERARENLSRKQASQQEASFFWVKGKRAAAQQQIFPYGKSLGRLLTDWMYFQTQTTFTIVVNYVAQTKFFLQVTSVFYLCRKAIFNL